MIITFSLKNKASNKTRERKAGVLKATLGRAQHFSIATAPIQRKAPPNQSSPHTWMNLAPIKTPGESICESSESSPKNLMLKATCQMQ